MSMLLCNSVCVFLFLYIFFFKQKTAYEMRISDWSSDVCSSDLLRQHQRVHLARDIEEHGRFGIEPDQRLHPIPRIGDDPGGAGRDGADVLGADTAVQRSPVEIGPRDQVDRKSTRLNSSH